MACYLIWSEETNIFDYTWIQYLCILVPQITRLIAFRLQIMAYKYSKASYVNCFVTFGLLYALMFDVFLFDIKITTLTLVTVVVIAACVLIVALENLKKNRKEDV